MQNIKFMFEFDDSSVNKWLWAYNATQNGQHKRVAVVDKKMRREALELCTKYTKYRTNPTKRNAMQSKWSTAELALLLMLLYETL